jgi:methyltransferase (TIGR00027 family)
MDPLKPSASAQQVALVRAHLTWRGVLEDTYAQSMLRPPWRELARLSRSGAFAWAGRNSMFGYLAARTAFYDQAIRDALDRGASQVVIVGAGYDSRAWRLARSGVRFFEVDHPATQADKRARAPAGGATFVAVDLDREGPEGPLRRSGFSDTETAIYVVEGLIIYLAPERVRHLFTALSELGGAHSSLVTNFGIAAERSAHTARAVASRALIALRGEPVKFRLAPHDAPGFLAETGWTVDTELTGPELAERYLAGTGLSARRLMRDNLLFVTASKASGSA